MLGSSDATEELSGSTDESVLDEPSSVEEPMPESVEGASVLDEP